MSRNWAEMGIEWDMSPVSQQMGDNATDRVELGQIPVPRLTNIDLAIKSGLSNAILAGVNGTSWRVKAQDVGRRALEKNRKADRDAMKDAIFSRLQSIRTAATITLREHRFADGTKYEGDDEVEYRQLAVEQYVEMGVEASVAVQLASKLVW